MRKDLTGNVYGKLSVTGVSEVSRNGHYRYNVLCECGTIKTVLGTHLISEKTKSCGCLRRMPPRNWAGCGSVPKAYFSSVMRGADGGKGRKGMVFDITIEYASNLLDNIQAGKCALTGLPISCAARTASIDRIDSSAGYVEGNIQWLHKDINMMKRHYSTHYFLMLCKKVVEYA